MHKEDIKRFTKKHLVSLGITLIAVIVISYALIRLTNYAGAATAKLAVGLGWICSLMFPLLVGFIIAYLLSPLVRWQEGKLGKIPRYRSGKKSPRGIAVLGAYFIVIVAIVALLSMIVSSVTHSVRLASFEDIPNIVDEFSQKGKDFYGMAIKFVDQLGVPAGKIDAAAKDGLERLSTMFQGFGGKLWSGIGGIKTTMTSLLFGLIFSIYFLLDQENLTKYWSRAFRAIFGNKTTNFCSMLLGDANRVFSGYIKGQFADALFMAVTVSIALLIIGVDYAVIIGVLTGIGNLIPYVGPFVAYAATILVCAVGGDWKTLVIAAIALVILQFVDGNIVNPKLMSKNVEIHPVLVIVSLLIGGATGGLIGMIIAVPVAGFLKIQFERIIDCLESRKKLKAMAKKEE